VCVYKVDVAKIFYKKKKFAWTKFL